MSMQLALSRLAQSDVGSDLSALRDLVAEIRPQTMTDVDRATTNLHALCQLLESNPEQARALRAYLNQVISSRKLSHLLTDTGITLSIGFWSEMWHRINYKWLPPVVRDEYLKDVFLKILHGEDYRWVCAVDDAVWMTLVHAIGFNYRDGMSFHAWVLGELLTATRILSYRISTIGLEPELVRNCPEIENFESPFLCQNVEINDYMSMYGNWMADRSRPREDSRHIDVLLSQCEEIVGKIRRSSAVQGVSVSLTRLLLRLTQSIERLRVLFTLLDAPNATSATPTAVQLFKVLVEADNRKHSLSHLINSNTELLALQVTQHASRTGEHYVANTRDEWLGMLRSAAGAGIIVGFMALLKLLASKLSLAPFGYALIYSLNYALGFILVYILHFTIATKQPAMTAALMAAALDSDKKKLDPLAELAIRMLRSQFVAILGNVALAVPVAYLIAWLWVPLSGHPLADSSKALHLLQDIDPIHGMALPYAAIAGICLFLSGLISGYYDNKAAYQDISARLQQLTWLQRLFGKARLAKTADYIGNNLGALAGNFFFGVMLGTVGTVGGFFGLPLDIRHVTFSSANFAFALVGLDNHLSAEQWILSLSGIALIGISNLAVSFALALTVALRSRRVNFKQEWSLAGVLWRRFCSAPRDFFLPPPEPVTVADTIAINNTAVHSEPSGLEQGND